MTHIAIVGAGRIGANLARLYAAAGHDVTVSFTRDQDKLSALTAQIGAAAADPARAIAQAEVVVISVPWGVVHTAIEQPRGPGALAGKLVIDTTNQFGRTASGFGVLDLGDSSAAALNSAKAPQPTWAKAFNTLTAGFQASSPGRTGPDRVVIFYATDHDDAVLAVERLIDDAGFTRSAPARWPAPNSAIRSPRATCTARSSTTRTHPPLSAGSVARPPRAAAALSYPFPRRRMR